MNENKRLILIVFILVVVISLLGCVEQEKSEKAAPYISIDDKRKPFDKVLPLPSEIVEAYQKNGIQPGLLNPIVDNNGQVFLFEYLGGRDKKIIDEEVVFPIENIKKLNWMRSIVVMQWEGSKCALIEISGRLEVLCSHD